MQPVSGIGIARLLPRAEISAELKRRDSVYSPSGMYDRIIATFEELTKGSIFALVDLDDPLYSRRNI
jgi:hypothetical protein